MKMTLAEIATYLPASIPFLEEHQLDYYQNGSKTLEQVCEERNIDFQRIDSELNQVIETDNFQFPNLKEYAIKQLLHFLDITFHAKEEEDLNAIEKYLLVLATHENSKIQYIVRNVRIIFSRLKEQLLQHCEREEKTFFPYILKLVEAKNNRSNLSSHSISLIKNPIKVLENEHIETLFYLNDIRETMNDYAEIQDESTYNDLANTMKQFEFNLHLHFHIENNLLFPKFIELKDELKERVAEKYF